MSLTGVLRLYGSYTAMFMPTKCFIYIFQSLTAEALLGFLICQRVTYAADHRRKLICSWDPFVIT